MAVALVIDDDPDIRSLLSMALELDGHDVRAGHSGANGLTQLRELVEAGMRPVVILDVHMPDMDGWDVLEHIRSESGFDGVAVTLCTVRAMQYDLDRGARLGCDAYESKPFDIASLSRRVTELSETATDELVARRRSARQSVDAH